MKKKEKSKTEKKRCQCKKCNPCCEVPSSDECAASAYNTSAPLDVDPGSLVVFSHAAPSVGDAVESPNGGTDFIIRESGVYTFHFGVCGTTTTDEGTRITFGLQIKRPGTPDITLEPPNTRFSVIQLPAFPNLDPTPFWMFWAGTIDLQEGDVVGLRNMSNFTVQLNNGTTPNAELTLECVKKEPSKKDKGKA